MHQFADEYITSSFSELAEMLGPDVAPIQVEALVKADAIAKQEFDRFAKVSLIRFIKERLPEGWMNDDASAFQRAHLFGSWSSSLGEQNRPTALIVWKRLQDELGIPERWTPQDENDRLLVMATQGLRFVPPSE